MTCLRASYCTTTIPLILFVLYLRNDNLKKFGLTYFNKQPLVKKKRLKFYYFTFIIFISYSIQ